MSDGDLEVECSLVGTPAVLSAGYKHLILLSTQHHLVVSVLQLLHLELVEPCKGSLVAKGNPLVSRENQDVLTTL